MTTTSPSTRDLFQQATDAVRNTPIVPPDRRPAFTLPKVPAAHVAPAAGPVEGLAGDLWDTATEVREGRLSASALAERAMVRIKHFDAQFGAFEYVADFEAEAAQRDASGPSGPLHGLPISVKDIIDVAAMPTSGSSVALAARQAVEDATAVARLRAAGAVIVGKAATHEFALGVTTPQAFSPWDTARVPGGSSGGSAISLVTGMALGSLGTDTRASIRVPAALCGLVGFKPSLNLVPTDHWLTLSWSLDHFAPMARTVRDVAFMMDTLADAPGRFTGVLPGSMAGRRVGYTEGALAGAEAGVVARFEASLDSMERAGAAVVRLESPTPDDYALANAVGMIVSRAEAAHFHREAGTDLDRCIPEVRDQLREASDLRATDYVRSLRLRGQLRETMAAAIAGVDILAMPTCKVVAPLRSEADEYLLVLSENCIPWSLIDFPAISLPMGLSNGLPCGIQFVAAPGQDLLLLSMAYAFERVAPEPPVWRPH